MFAKRASDSTMSRKKSKRRADSNRRVPCQGRGYPPGYSLRSCRTRQTNLLMQLETEGTDINRFARTKLRNGGKRSNLSRDSVQFVPSIDRSIDKVKQVPVLGVLTLQGHSSGNYEQN